MQKDPNQQEKIWCLHCKRYILAHIFQLHEARCSLMSSRVRHQENQESRKSINNSKSGRIEEKGPNVRTSAIERKKIFRENNNEESQRVPCSFCGYQQTFAQLDTHPNLCPFGQKKCQYCDQSFPQGLMQEHQQVCDARNQLHNQRNHIHSEQPEEILHSDEDQDENSFYRLGNFRSFLQSPHTRNNGHVIIRESDGRGGVIIRELFSNNGSHLEPQFPEMRRGDLRNQRNGNAGFLHQLHPFFAILEAFAAREQEQQGLTKQQMKKIERIRYKPDNNIKKEEKDLCTICYCQFQLNEKIVKLKCKHIYHQECIFKWLEKNAKCPVCKTPQTDRPIYRQQ